MSCLPCRGRSKAISDAPGDQEGWSSPGSVVIRISREPSGLITEMPPCGAPREKAIFDPSVGNLAWSCSLARCGREDSYEGDRRKGPRLRRSASATRAAEQPHIPCTPPPGGVDEEHRYTPRIGVRYGTRLRTGRKKSCPRFIAPPFRSPPTRFRLCASSATGARALRAR